MPHTLQGLYMAQPEPLASAVEASLKALVDAATASVPLAIVLAGSGILEAVAGWLVATRLASNGAPAVAQVGV